MLDVDFLTFSAFFRGCQARGSRPRRGGEHQLNFAGGAKARTNLVFSKPIAHGIRCGIVAADFANRPFSIHCPKPSGPAANSVLHDRPNVGQSRARRPPGNARRHRLPAKIMPPADFVEIAGVVSAPPHAKIRQQFPPTFARRCHVPSCSASRRRLQHVANRSTDCGRGIARLSCCSPTSKA